MNIPCCIFIFMADTECLDVEVANKHRAKCLEEVEAKYINIDKEKAEEQKKEEEKNKLEF